MFISLRELRSLFTGLFAGSNPRKIDGGATLACTAETVPDDETVEIAPASSVRRRVIIQNSGGQVVAIGPEGVTTADGHVLAAGADGTGGVITLFTQDAICARAAGAPGEVRVLVEAD